MWSNVQKFQHEKTDSHNFLINNMTRYCSMVNYYHRYFDPELNSGLNCVHYFVHYNKSSMMDYKKWDYSFR